MLRMASPQTFDPAQAEKLQPHLKRILNSDSFRKAPNLRNLLEYLVAKSSAGQFDQLKESVIAMEVFSRRTNFDGRLDNIVRVQAHRLRKLLDAYYVGDGKDEKIRISVPRGGYAAQFRFLDDAVLVEEALHDDIPEATAATPEATPPAEILPAVQAAKPASSSSIGRLAVYAAIFLGGIALSALFSMRDRGIQVDGPVAEIWKGIYEPGIRLIVSYTNPVFLRVGHSRTYLLYRGPLSASPGTQINIADTDPGIDPQYASGGQPLFFSDGWTGTGEVLGVNRLTELGVQFKDKIVVIPSRALALNEVRSSNVVFLGSPWMNGVLAQFGNESTPIFNTNDGRIVIRDPKKGEQAVYENIRDNVTSEIKASYALFSVLPGIDKSRKVVSSAGIGTWSTWGAIDFATTDSGATHLVSTLKELNHGRFPRFFQAVIRTEIIKGAASNESLVAARVVQSP